MECDLKDVPSRLAGIVLPYLKDTLGQDIVKAEVSAGQKWMTYLIQLQNGTVSVYRLEAKFVREKEQDLFRHPSRAAPPPAKKSVA